MTRTDTRRPKESDELYEFMMEEIPYEYVGEDPRFLTRAEAKASPDPAIRAEAEKATEDGPDGMMYQVLGPALQYLSANHKRLDAKDQQDILLNKSPEGLWWHYDNKYYRVTKALKIPYLVHQKVDGNVKAVVKHILVGYSGIDGGGG